MLIAYGISDTGVVRKGNEDGFICSDALGLYAVADGMGGHQAGEVASRVALQALEDFVRRTGNEGDCSWPFGFDAELSLQGNRLSTAMHLANREVFQVSETRDEYTGMGTTMTAVLASPAGLSFAHVGDSRLYLLAGDDFRQLTRDDSWVATVLGNDPALNAAELARHPMRHVLTNVIGARETVEVQAAEVPLRGEQLFLICSDGLHGLVDDGAMRRILAAGGPLEELGGRLLQAALDRGGYDNVTAVLLRHTSQPS
jgi:protein phosphatase